MSEKNSKPNAKCCYHHLCSLFNNDVLTKIVEQEMCGSNQKPDIDFKPKATEPAHFSPTEHYPHGSGEICDAFMRFKDSKLIEVVREQLGILQKHYEKHGYW